MLAVVSLVETVPSFNGDGASANAIVDRLVGSTVYRQFHDAFTNVANMPLALCSAESWKLPFRGSRQENRFCALMSDRNATCAACLALQSRLVRSEMTETCTLDCPFGLTESAVPVRNGTQIVAVLRTGQVLRRIPDERDFNRVETKLKALGITGTAALKHAYLATPVVPAQRYGALIELLSVFAQQLATVSNEVMIQQVNREPITIARAKEYIRQHNTEELSLKQVARAVNTSAPYFCRLFKKSTGINYNQYRTRVRLEQAKQLLLNPHLRIGEVAFEVGFQSLTHFNRVFKKLLGQSPTEFRAQHHAVWAETVLG